MSELLRIDIIETGFEGIEDDFPAGSELIYPTLG
jgi:hypothetical protein